MPAVTDDVVEVREVRERASRALVGEWLKSGIELERRLEGAAGMPGSSSRDQHLAVVAPNRAHAVPLEVARQSPGHCTRTIGTAAEPPPQHPEELVEQVRPAKERILLLVEHRRHLRSSRSPSTEKRFKRPECQDRQHYKEHRAKNYCENRYPRRRTARDLFEVSRTPRSGGDARRCVNGEVNQ